MILGLVEWWYGPGWVGEWRRQTRRLARLSDYFSFGLLLKTLFQPFRQIDAGGTRGGLSVKFRSWIDRSISRIIGAFVRLIVLIIGSIWWLISVILALAWMLIWPLLPLAPGIGLVITIIGVVM